MCKTSLKTAVSQLFNFKFNTFIHRHFDNTDFDINSLFPKFMVKYNHKIKEKGGLNANN